MNYRDLLRSCVGLGLGIIGVLLAAPACAADAKPIGRPVDYNREIKPLLSDRCYACHGPDDAPRKAKLRLDVREQAIKKAIEPGNAAGSRLIERIASNEPEEVMPPSSSKKPRLTPEQVETFRRWIDQGAKFDTHWAFLKPVRPPLPAVKNKAWTRNAVDEFIAAGHEAHGLKPSAEADRVTLIRRLSFDLIGLPPTPTEVAVFLQDQSPDAYDKLVDRLLDSPHFGERMALYWLDLVRFADTAGYHSDNHRDVTFYRDYVIKAFNDNKHFDQFTIEQLAGDLLPSPTTEQKIASGYNRLLMTTEEGGAQAKEYTAKYAADRVRNASVVWLAATLGCAECHNHKFDPYSTKDFYSFAAFFADVKETPVGRQEQTPLPSRDQAAELKQLDAQLAELRRSMARQTVTVDARQAAWEKDAQAQLALTKPDGKAPQTVKKIVPDAVARVIGLATEKRSPKEKELVASHHRNQSVELAKMRSEISNVENKRNALLKIVPSTLVSVSVAPRMMRVLPRGNWLDDSGEIVSPAVPAVLSLGGSAGRATRLDLAKWLVSRDNPLAARVFVNRLWRLAFGQGIVKTLDDFGAQGEMPSHPQLLDWLAVEFIDSGWNIKHLLKLMLLSSTYRQTSVAGKELRDTDPGNRWLTRQSRFRIDAEMVRDNALEISGLLNRKIGGPSVKPYQPAGYWQYLNFPTREYFSDHGPSQYRRGLYTYWQRTFPHPSLIAFDAPSREECTVERPRSSTPLQALVLLNDPSYVEAARVFAESIIKKGGTSLPGKLDWAYRRALARGIKTQEIEVLAQLYRKHQQEYRADKAAAEHLVSTGESPVTRDIDTAELATWTSLARVILNLHETITRN